MESDDSLKDKRQVRKYTSLMIVLLLIFILIVIKYITGFESNYYKDKFVDAIFSSIITVAFFNLAYDYFARNRTLKELQLAFTTALVSKKDSISRLSKNEIKEVIKNSISSIINEEKGILVYNTLVCPYLDSKYNFRSDFRYLVSVEEMKAPAQPQHLLIKNIDPSEYHTIHQSIRYTRTYHNEITKQLCVGFAYNEPQLDAWLSSDDFFFRELLFLKNEHVVFLKNLDEEQLLGLMKDFFNFSAYYYCDAKEIAIDWNCIKVEKKTDGCIICIDLEKLNPSSCSKSKQKFKINFCMPQLKSNRHFLFVIPEPTEKPFIQFTYHDKMKNVIAFPFFSNTTGNIKDLSHNTVTFEINNWVFPRSGVLFTWDKER